MRDENLLRDEFNSIAAELGMQGLKVTISGYRKWYNPMRLIKGDRYESKIHVKYLHA